MVATSAVLLVAYLTTIIVVLNLPGRGRAGDDAQAVGCLSFIAFAIVLLGVVLAVAACFHAGILVRIISAIAIFPALILTPQLAYFALNAWKKKRSLRQTQIRPELLAARLTGQTHVIRLSSSQPPRQWTELRYYAPDGRLVGYIEEAGHTTRFPFPVTWSVEEDCLVTQSPQVSDKKKYYSLWETTDGQVVYYLHDAGPGGDGVAVMRSIPIRAGEPAPTDNDTNTKAP